MSKCPHKIQGVVSIGEMRTRGCLMRKYLSIEREAYQIRTKTTKTPSLSTPLKGHGKQGIGQVEYVVIWEFFKNMFY